MVQYNAAISFLSSWFYPDTSENRYVIPVFVLFAFRIARKIITYNMLCA
jgi:hypothetical protein